MRNCLSPSSNSKSTFSHSIDKNCDCDCHHHEETNFNYMPLNRSRNNNLFSIQQFSQQKTTEVKPKSKYNLMLCQCPKICNCSCHYSSPCTCCPCIKTRQNSNMVEYYKDLYLQTKTELENEKKKK